MLILFLCPYWPKAYVVDGVHPAVARQARYLRAAGDDVVVRTIRTREELWRRRRPSDWTEEFSEYDVVHCHWAHMILFAMAASPPVVVTFHGGELDTARSPGRRLAFLATERLCLAKASRLVAVSEHYAARLDLRARTRTLVLPTGVDRRVFRPFDGIDARRLLGLPLHRRLVLFPADKDNRVKDYPLAERAVALLGRADVELVPLGEVPYETVAAYANACDAMILTSVREGAPAVVKEALCCGLPVVSVDVGDVRRLLAGINGCYVVQSRTPAELADALRAVLARSERIAPRPEFEAFDEGRSIEALRALYASLPRRVPI